MDVTNQTQGTMNTPQETKDKEDKEGLGELLLPSTSLDSPFLPFTTLQYPFLGPVRRQKVQSPAQKRLNMDPSSNATKRSKQVHDAVKARPHSILHLMHPPTHLPTHPPTHPPFCISLSLPMLITILIIMLVNPCYNPYTYPSHCPHPYRSPSHNHLLMNAKVIEQLRGGRVPPALRPILSHIQDLKITYQERKLNLDVKWCHSPHAMHPMHPLSASPPPICACCRSRSPTIETALKDLHQSEALSNIHFASKPAPREPAPRETRETRTTRETPTTGTPSPSSVFTNMLKKHEAQQAIVSIVQVHLSIFIHGPITPWSSPHTCTHPPIHHPLHLHVYAYHLLSSQGDEFSWSSRRCGSAL